MTVDVRKIYYVMEKQKISLIICFTLGEIRTEFLTYIFVPPL